MITLTKGNFNILESGNCILLKTFLGYGIATIENISDQMKYEVYGYFINSEFEVVKNKSIVIDLNDFFEKNCFVGIIDEIEKKNAEFLINLGEIDYESVEISANTEKRTMKIL